MKSLNRKNIVAPFINALPAAKLSFLTLHILLQNTMMERYVHGKG